MLEKAKLSEPSKSLLCLIYGPDGVGKTTFGIDGPKPFVLGKEKGIPDGRKVMSVNPGNFSEVLQTIKDLIKEKHDYETLVIDSLDWLEPLNWDHVCKADGKSSIEDVGGGYGAGYIRANAAWMQMIELLAALRSEREMNIVLLAHSEVKIFNDPSQPAPYDRYQIKLNGKAAALWREFVDLVGFANEEVFTKVSKDGKKSKAFGDGKRILYTQRRPSFDAKNRLGLPFELPLSYTELQKVLRESQADKLSVLRADIDELRGLVSNPETRKIVDESIIKAGENTSKLEAILKRLKEITKEKA